MLAVNSPDRTNHQGPQGKKESTIKGWIIVFSIALFFFLWGLFIYYAVGVGQVPAWRYGVVSDVPGQSVYSIQRAEEQSDKAISEEKTVRKQHIMGRREETGKPQSEKGL
jgi:hypothetical protein